MAVATNAIVYQKNFETLDAPAAIMIKRNEFLITDYEETPTFRLISH